MVTRPAVDRFRPGIIACESSSVNFRGQLPTLPRNTATGMPGASTDLATMKSVSPAVALAAKPAANVTSPVTATPDPTAGDPAAEADADDFASPANEGSCFARAFAASAGRPRNSNDLASSSQSSGVPPPLASLASKAEMALSMEPAAGFGAAPSAPSGVVAGPVASPNTFAAVPKAPALPDVAAPAVAAGGDGLSATSERTSQLCDAKNAATTTIATTDPCQGAGGNDAKPGMLRSNGDSTTRRASVVSTPAKNQNNGINIP